MDDLSRAEYPGMLANLQPGQAVQILADRVKRISKINVEIADWLQERRKVEEQYANNLRKLLVYKVPNASSELGVFQPPWDKILQSVEAVAASHVQFAARIEQDVEMSLRNFSMKQEMQNMQTISANLATMAKELEDAQEKSDKLIKKGGKANVQKVDMATNKLDSATQQWDSQAPFIFETLQAVDEQRINHMRDVLTQLLTHEVDQATRSQSAAEKALNAMLEINTKVEIEGFARRALAGKAKLDRRAPVGPRQSSLGPGPFPATPTTLGHDDNNSEHSVPREGQSEFRLRSRIGTMLGRRRQSVHGGFGPISDKSRHLGFTRNIGSSHGRVSISPKPSSNNLHDSSQSQNRLSSLVESPTGDEAANTAGVGEGSEGPKPSLEGTNGVSGHEGSGDAAHMRFMSNFGSSILNGTPEDIFDGPPPAAPPPALPPQGEAAKDADGFTIPTIRHDPISEAMKFAVPEADEADQFFKLNIQNEPIADEDQAAKQAALCNVASTLQMGMPSRKSGTVRGRRDVRNTLYAPNLSVPELSTPAFPPSPSLPTSLAASRSTGVTTLASEYSHASDNQSIRSGTSLGSTSVGGMSRLKHPDFHGPAHGPGLHGSIIETVSAMFEEGQLKSASISGEVAFAFTPDAASSSSGYETIRLNNFTNLSAIGPNRAFVANVDSSPEEFTLDVSQLAVTSPAFTYRVHAEDDVTSLGSHCPIFLNPAWKTQGDKLNFLLQYRLNPSCTLPRPVTLSNVVFVASYEGARASGVQTKPSGTHLKDKHLVYWRLGDLVLPDDWSKIICRVVGEQNAEPRPGQVEVRWDYHAADGRPGSGISVSRLAEAIGKGKGKATDGGAEVDPFADEGGLASPRETRSWTDVPLTTSLVSGKYEAK